MNVNKKHRNQQMKDEVLKMKFALIRRNGKVIATRRNEAEANFEREEQLALVRFSLENATKELFSESCTEDMKAWAIENIIKPTEEDLVWFGDRTKCIVEVQ